MASVQEQLKLKRVPIDKWSTREQLCLASSVLRSGDQNWMSVSRSVKVFGEPNRPEDWFSQKNCAVQYSTMLEKAETPKRKKRSGSSDKDGPVETAGEIILRKYTAERIEELKAILEAERSSYLKVQKELSLMERCEATPEQIAEWTSEMENEKKQKEVDAQSHALWLRERERKKAQLERAWKPHLTHATRRKLGIVPESPGSQAGEGVKELDSSVDGSLFNADVLSDDSTEPKVLSPAPTSPFLTSLLKNPPPSKMVPPSSSILHSAITSSLQQQRGTTPTITSLLSSSPGVPLSAAGTKMATAAAVGSDDMAGVPTLSMLLQIPPGGGGGSEKTAAGMDSFAASGTGAFGHPSLRHQDMQLIKAAATDTDEILDVVDVEQSLVEDMEPIEIGLEEIIADLEQAANQDAALAAAATAAVGGGGGKGPLLEENIALDDIPETPTNVDTFHKIFDDFYAMNVVKPKAEETDVKVEAAAQDGQGAAIGGVLDQGAADEKQFVVSQFDVSREAMNAELDSAVAYVEERETESVVNEEEAKVDVNAADSIFDSLLSPRPSVETYKIAEPEAAEYEGVPSGRGLDNTNKFAVPQDLGVAESATVVLEPEGKTVVEEVVPEKTEELIEVKTEPETLVEDAQSISLENKPIVARQAADRTKEKASTIKSVTDDHSGSRKPSKHVEKTEERVSKKSKSRDKSEVAVDSEASRKDVPSILKTELLKHPEKSEEVVPDKVGEKITETFAVAKEDTAGEVAGDAVTVKQEPVLDEVEIVPSEKSAALIEEMDESTKDGEDKTTDSLHDSEKAGECSDSGVAPSEIPIQEKLASSEIVTPKSEFSVSDFPSSSRRLMRRTGTPAIDSLPGSPASGSVTDEEKEHRAWKKAIMLVWNSLAAHKCASIFCRPITDEMAPLYSIKIKRPMDLSTIKRNIETGVIRTTAEFHNCLMVMFLNACMYNETWGTYFMSALEMQKDCMQQIQDFEATQKLIQSPGDSATTRRETRTTADTTNMGKRKRESDVGKSAKKRKV